MHVKIKENKIIIEFTEREATFIMQKVGKSGLEDVSNYIKEKLAEALSFDELEISDQNVGRDFNLNKLRMSLLN